jgi:type I restriction enzyme S subunit
MFGDPATNPKHWPTKPLEEVAEIGTRLVDPAEAQYQELVHIGGEEIEKGTGRILEPKTVRECALISAKFVFSEKHVLYCKIRPYLNKVAYPRTRGLCSADIYPILSNEALIRPWFLVALLRSPAFLSYAEVHSERLRMPKLNRDQLGAYKVPLPALAIQGRFQSFAEEIEKVYGTQLHQRERSDHLFDLMLHRAFSGDLTAKWREAHMNELLTETEEQAKLLGLHSVESGISEIKRPNT